MHFILWKRTGGGSESPDYLMIYSLDHLEEGDKKNDLTIYQLYHDFDIKTPTCLLHNIYEVILRVIYYCPHYLLFPKIRHSYDRLATFVSPTHLLDHSVFPLTHINLAINAIVNT